MSVWFWMFSAIAQNTSPSASTPHPIEPVESIADEIFIWSDPYARWRDTRWYIETEVVLPSPLPFASKKRSGFSTFAVQVRGVLSCSPEYERAHMQVGCRIDEIAIQAAAIQRTGATLDEARIQSILDETVADLTHAVIQLQTNEHGAVTNLDLEGVPINNPHQRLRAENLRQLAGRLVYPFHLKLPDTLQVGTNWPETNSAMMTMPSYQRSMGNSLIVHYLDSVDDHLIVQDIGKGSVAFASLLHNPKHRSTVDTLPPTMYRIRMDGVSVFAKDTGIMSERVWAIQGTGDNQRINDLPLWYSGRILQLRDRETADVGPTQQVNAPWSTDSSLPGWPKLDPAVLEKIDNPSSPPSPGVSPAPFPANHEMRVTP